MDYYSFNRPRRDGWLSWPCWLTDSGRLTHKVVTRPAVSLAQDRESSPAKTGGLTTMLRNQSRLVSSLPAQQNCITLDATSSFDKQCRTTSLGLSVKISGHCLPSRRPRPLLLLLSEQGWTIVTAFRTVRVFDGSYIT